MARKSLIERAKHWLGLEGSWRGPFQGFSESGRSFMLGPIEDGFQRNLTRADMVSVAALQGAINAHVHAFQLMPAAHMRLTESGGWEEVTTSALSRWLAAPNALHTPAEFYGCLIRMLLERGNVVVVGFENNRYEVENTLIAEHFQPRVDPDSGEVFYEVTLGSGEKPMMVPFRNIMHLRLNATARDPLRGISPIAHCAASLATNATLSSFLVSYLNNRASPSYALTTDATMTREQLAQLRTAWNEQSKSLQSGGTPILSNGLKPVMLGVAPGDELLVSTFNLTVTDIARAFSMPKALLGIDETASNAENLYRAWISLGLGAMVELVEQGIERLFRLPRNERVEFDSDALLRLDSEAQARRVAQLSTSGVLAPDEARAALGYAPISGGLGRVPYAQQQMVPLTLLTELHAADIAAKTKPEPEPEPPAPTPDEQRAAVVELIRQRRRVA